MQINNAIPRHLLTVSFSCNGKLYQLTDLHYPFNDQFQLKPPLPALCAQVAGTNELNEIEDIEVIQYQRFPNVIKKLKAATKPKDGEWWFCATKDLGKRVVLFRKGQQWVKHSLANFDLTHIHEVKPIERLFTRCNMEDLFCENAVLKSQVTLVQRRNKKLQGIINQPIVIPSFSEWCKLRYYSFLKNNGYTQKGLKS